MNKKTFFKKQKREGISYKVIFGFILLCLFAYIPYTYYLSLSLEYTKTQEVFEKQVRQELDKNVIENFDNQMSTQISIN